MNKLSRSLIVMVVAAALFAGCSGGPLTTREKGAAIGGVGGAAAGGLIGATVGHPIAGAAIGGALGLGAGAIIGDHMQSHENQQQQQIKRNETERRRLESERARRQPAEY